MELDEEYPKARRQRTTRIQALLEMDTGLEAKEREALAISLNQMADKARDLDDIIDRLLNETHTPAEVGELLIAFELTTEQIRGHSDTIDGQLYAVGDRLKSAKVAGAKR